MNPVEQLQKAGGTLRLNEVASMLGMSRRTIQRMMRNAEIPHWRVRHMVWFDAKQLAAWFEEHYVGADRLHVDRRKNPAVGRARKAVSASPGSLQ